MCDEITLISNGKIIKSDSKNNLVNLFGEKKVTFILENNNFSIPKELETYNAILENDKLILNYNKSKNNIKKIIDILNLNQIDFVDFKTDEGSLEKTFVKLINND